ncbi:hypothetical protein EDB85DRAFT_1892417 [Lactarius pseudohatsudake]|nr:hypothetical protein EDB85DRAFT_1892417 [Lactarius pseudohatsudake]
MSSRRVNLCKTNGTQEGERAMLKMTTCGRFVREGHEKDRVDIFWTNGLCDGAAVSVDVKKRICGWKRAKGGLHDWLGVGRVQDDERARDTAPGWVEVDPAPGAGIEGGERGGSSLRVQRDVHTGLAAVVLYLMRHGDEIREGARGVVRVLSARQFDPYPATRDFSRRANGYAVLDRKEMAWRTRRRRGVAREYEQDDSAQEAEGV